MARRQYQTERTSREFNVKRPGIMRCRPKKIGGDVLQICQCGPVFKLLCDGEHRPFINLQPFTFKLINQVLRKRVANAGFLARVGVSRHRRNIRTEHQHAGSGNEALDQALPLQVLHRSFGASSESNRYWAKLLTFLTICLGENLRDVPPRWRLIGRAHGVEPHDPAGRADRPVERRRRGRGCGRTACRVDWSGMRGGMPHRSAGPTTAKGGNLIARRPLAPRRRRRQHFNGFPNPARAFWFSVDALGSDRSAHSDVLRAVLSKQFLCENRQTCCLGQIVGLNHASCEPLGGKEKGEGKNLALIALAVVLSDGAL
jgi:hypothetical protein